MEVNKMSGSSPMSPVAATHALRGPKIRGGGQEGEGRPLLGECAGDPRNSEYTRAACGQTKGPLSVGLKENADSPSPRTWASCHRRTLEAFELKDVVMPGWQV